MDFDGGVTPIDTLYEWSGLVMAERLANIVLWGRVFVGILIAGAILRLFYLSQKKESYFDLVAYPVYLAFMFFLVAPVTVTVKPRNTVFSGLWNDMNQAQVSWGSQSQTAPRGPDTFQVRVPRIIAVTHRITDGLIRQ